MHRRRDRDHRRRPEARARTGEISKVQGPTTCTADRRRPESGPLGVFDCYTVVRKVPKVETNVAGSIGYPFRAVVNYSTFTYAFCRTEQFPGEQLIPDPRTVVQLPAACRRSTLSTSPGASLWALGTNT